MIDVRAVLQHARRQAPPTVDPDFVDQLETRLIAGHGATTGHLAPPAASRRTILGRAAAVLIVVAVAGLALHSQRGGDTNHVRTGPSASITTSTSPESVSSATTSVTVPPEVPSTAPPSTTQPLAGGPSRSTVPTSTTELLAGGTTGRPTTTTMPESSQQQYVTMSCDAANDSTVTCAWAEPTVAVAEWRVVRRHVGDNEVPLPTTQSRRITDPTASPGTTYTYVVNGYDASGRSVALGSASVSTPTSTSTTTAPTVQDLHLACMTDASSAGVSCQWDASTSRDLGSYRLVRRTQDGPETVVYMGSNRSASERSTTGAHLIYTVTALASDGTVLGRSTVEVTCC